jgi:xylulose-5-phosphate/fructose-6-phosphate phosphoketolase
MPAPLSPDLLETIDAYWRAANYLTVGQIYLQDNPLLETALKIGHIKPRLRSLRWTTVGECSAKFERTIQRTSRHTH